jgi:hypothetical protein
MPINENSHSSALARLPPLRCLFRRFSQTADLPHRGFLLHHAGLLDVRREGRILYYGPNSRHMNELLGFPTDPCCERADDSCSSAECKPRSARV